MLRRLLSRATRDEPEVDPTPAAGQLDNQALEAIVFGIVKREDWDEARSRIVVEVGTGGGRGSTVAIERALAAGKSGFQLIGYEGDADLAAQAANYWSDGRNVRVVNEFFMHRDDIERIVKPLVAEGDRASYLPEFAAVAQAENFLTTVPPGPIDLLFIDSVRYTHLAILRAASPWLTAETVVVMEDDIPGYGELAIVDNELDLLDVTRHELVGHPWPLVEFRLVP